VYDRADCLPSISSKRCNGIRKTEANGDLVLIVEEGRGCGGFALPNEEVMEETFAFAFGQ
jgi:hypothetical protein